MYCQKCRTPLKADAPLQNLNPAAFDLLVGTAARTNRVPSANLNYPTERKQLYDGTLQRSTSAQQKRNVPAPRIRSNGTSDQTLPKNPTQNASSNPGMSFIEVTQSQIVVPNEESDTSSLPQTRANITLSGGRQGESSLAWQKTRHERLFSILSSQSDVDHPVCTECSSMLIGQSSLRLASATRERDAYVTFLNALHQAHEPPKNNGIAGKELQDLKTRSKQSYQELVTLEEEKQALELTLTELEEEDRRLDTEERACWEQRNKFDMRIHNLEIDIMALQGRSLHDSDQLEKLQRTNVYNDTFCIGHDGHFGTINGLRLGRLPSQNVEWAEINAAWGQTLLLLATIAERVGFAFTNFKLRPLGSNSRIERVEWPQQPPNMGAAAGQAGVAATSPPKITQLDLFSSGDMLLGRVFNHRRFDAGMVAFLECLAQLGAHVEKISQASGLVQQGLSKRQSISLLPYTIQGDKIGDVSIRLGVGFSQDENFTKACKYALTCCKFLLAHVSNVGLAKGT